MNFLTDTKNRDRLLLLAVFAVFSVSSLVWAHRDLTPPPWDPSDHLRFAYDYYQPLAHLHLTDFYREFFLAEHFYAPLVHLVTACSFLVFGPSETSGIAVNLLSLVILMASLYWLGNRLYPRRSNRTDLSDTTSGAATNRSNAGAGERTGPGDGGLLFSAGALAGVIAASYHFPAWLLHDAFLDFPLTAAVAATFALLIRADDFKNRRHAIHFGVAAGLGLLVKETFPFFFLLPAVYVVVRVVISRNRRSMFNLVLAALVAAAIASIWYLPHLADVAKIYQINKQAAVEENEAPLFSFMSNVVYLHGLVSYQIQAVFGGLFGIGLVYSLVRRARESVMLYLWVMSGIVGFTMLANKDMRYTIPILPAVALLSVSWANDFPAAFSHLSVRKLREIGAAIGFKKLAGSRPNGTVTLPSWMSRATGYIIVILIVGFSFASFANAQWPRPGEGEYIDTPHFRWMVFARNYFQFDHSPTKDDWSAPEIAQALTRLSEQQAPPNLIAANNNGVPIPGSTSAASGPPTVGIFVNLPYLNPSSVALYGRLLAKGRGAPAPFKVEWLVEPDRLKFVPKCQYFVVRTGLDRAEWVAPLERYAEKLINEHPQKYVAVAKFPIPQSDSQAIIYRVEE